MTDSLSASWWAAGADHHAAILIHPFLLGLADGTLDREIFRHYIVQDSHYLRGYSRALSLLSARAPQGQEDAVEMFARHSAEAIETERVLHESLLADLGLGAAEVDRIGAGPTTTAYVDRLLTVCATGSWAEGIAAVLPCYWVYREVGRTLLERSSPDPLYARWIDTYGSAEFDAVVDQVLAVVDALDVSPAEGARCRDHFATATRYEWMFWDASWRRLEWPR